MRTRTTWRRGAAALRRLVGPGLLAVVDLVLATAAGPAEAQGPGPSPPGPPAAAVSEEAVAAIAAQLRCVVCQNLSVHDSPSEMARQMRDLIRERLAHGDTPAQVMAYFEARYGPWVLLSPRLQGFGLLAWLLPAAGLLGGAVAVAVLARRWARRGTAGSPGDGPAPLPATTAGPDSATVLDPADRERVRRELERLA